MFISFVLGFVGAVVLFYQRSQWPEMGVMAVMAGVTFTLFAFHRYWWPYKTGHFYVGLIIGFQWAFWHSFLQPNLPESVWQAIESSSSRPAWQVTGEVVGLPQRSTTSRGEKLSFDFKIDKLCLLLDKKIQNPQSCTDFSFWQGKPVIHLVDYQAQALPALHAGERWRLPVRLKPIHGLQNPGGFDFEASQWQKGIVSRGWVLHREAALYRIQKLEEASLWRSDVWREKLSQAVNQWWAESPYRGIYLALLLGDRSALTETQWEVFQRTGTAHLMSISGLHIGIVAGLGFVLFGGLWRLWIRFESRYLPVSRYWMQGVPECVFALVGMLLFATLYTLLAGFSIPTQRAWLMVVAVVIFLILKRPFVPTNALALAALLVVAWSPPSVLSAGFWLSFTAVAIIFAVLSHPKIKPLPNWQKALWIQLALTLGLTPLLSFYFHQWPIWSLMANLVAVPVVSMLALPLLLFSVAISPVLVLYAQGMPFLWRFNDELWTAIVDFLSWVSHWQAPWVLPALQGWLVVVIYGGLFYLGWLNQQGKLSWRIGLAVLLALALMTSVLLKKQEIPSHQAKVTVLDVGQGLSVVVETAYHRLVYDTGGRWGEHWDGANLAILPYLKAQGIRRVEMLMVSHSDLDHAGGTQRLLSQMPVDRWLSGQPDKVATLSQTPAERWKPCRSEDSWSWDGVRFEVLFPIAGFEPKNDNEASCVLKVTVGEQSVLLMGDAPKKVERILIRQAKAQKHLAQLHATVLVAGHHGSASSTSLDWLRTVQPQWVVFSSGYQNAFHFPNKKVIKRVEGLGILWVNTACSGAVQWRLGEEPLHLWTFRQQSLKIYHHRCPENQQGVLFQ